MNEYFLPVQVHGKATCLTETDRVVNLRMSWYIIVQTDGVILIVPRNTLV